MTYICHIESINSTVINSNYNTTNVLFRERNLIRDSKGNNYVYDNHGDVTSILSNSGTKTKEYDYNAFGVVEDETNQNTYNPWQYCGEYRDEESGLIYLRNRYYDSDSGRFINEDSYWNVDNIIYGDVELYNKKKYIDYFNKIAIFNINKKDNDIENEINSLEYKTKQKNMSGERNTYEFNKYFIKINFNQFNCEDYIDIGYNTDGFIYPNIKSIYQSNNLYNYCMANPIIYNDIYGNDALAVVGGAVAGPAGVVVGVVVSAAAGYLVGKGIVYYKEHTSNASPSKRNKHENGQTRKKRDNGGEKGDARRTPRKDKRK